MVSARILPPRRRFAFKLYQRGDCWEWRGHRSKAGYGVFNWSGRYGEEEYAHRHAYELAKGFLTLLLETDHICNHRWCVRPSHLVAVPHRLNGPRLGRRGLDHEARRRTHCPRGHAYSLENTGTTKQGWRRCRACGREDYHATVRRKKTHLLGGNDV